MFDELGPILFSQFVVIAALALVGAAVAGRLSLPGWVGGLIVGLLLAPGLAGQLLPGLYDPIFVGGQAEQRAIDERRAHNQDELEGLRSTGVTPTAIEETRAVMQPEMDALEADLAATHARYHESRRSLLHGLLLAALAAAGAVTHARLARQTLVDAVPVALMTIVVVAVGAAIGATVLGRMQPGNAGTLWFAGMMVGCFAAAAPLPRVIGRHLNHQTDDPALNDRPALAEATGLMLAALAWTMIALLQPSAMAGGEDEGLRLGVGLAAGIVVLVGLLVPLFGVKPLVEFAVQRGRAAGAIDTAVVLTAIVFAWLVSRPTGAIAPLVAWLVGLVLGARLVPSASEASAVGPTVAERVLAIVAPIAAAFIGMATPLVDAFDLWLVLVVAIVAGDIKATGLMLGSRLMAGRRWIEGLALGTAGAAGGIVPLGIAWTLYAGGMIDAALFVALVVAVGLGGLLAGPLLAVVARMQATMQEGTSARRH